MPSTLCAGACGHSRASMSPVSMGCPLWEVWRYERGPWPAATTPALGIKTERPPAGSACERLDRDNPQRWKTKEEAHNQIDLNVCRPLRSDPHCGDPDTALAGPQIFIVGYKCSRLHSQQMGHSVHPPRQTGLPRVFYYGFTPKLEPLGPRSDGDLAVSVPQNKHCAGVGHVSDSYANFIVAFFYLIPATHSRAVFAFRRWPICCIFLLPWLGKRGIINLSGPGNMQTIDSLRSGWANALRGRL